MLPQRLNALPRQRQRLPETVDRPVAASIERQAVVSPVQAETLLSAVGRLGQREST
jgi:hypothetical protein